jgi:hypothetical protein
MRRFTSAIIGVYAVLVFWVFFGSLVIGQGLPADEIRSMLYSVIQVNGILIAFHGVMFSMILRQIREVPVRYREAFLPYGIVPPVVYLISILSCWTFLGMATAESALGAMWFSIPISTLVAAVGLTWVMVALYIFPTLRGEESSDSQSPLESEDVSASEGNVHIEQNDSKWNPDALQREEVRGVFTIGILALVFSLRQALESQQNELGHITVTYLEIPTVVDIDLFMNGFLFLWGFYVLFMAISLGSDLVGEGRVSKFVFGLRDIGHTFFYMGTSP